MDEFLKYLTSFGLGGMIVGGVIFYAFKHPELVEKWRAQIFDWLVQINGKYKYAATKSDIQSKINDFVKNLSQDLDINPTRVKLRWTGQEDDEDIQLDDDEVIIVMRDRGYKNKNFVHAAYFYTSTMLLAHTKRHLSKKQGESLDLYTTKKVIETTNKSALQIFMKDYFQPLLEDEKIRKLINDFVSIDNSGMYTHVLLQELSYLGDKTFLDKKDGHVVEEVNNLISFLVGRAQREIGDVSGSEEYIGKYSRCSVKVVSTKFVRNSNAYQKPATRVLKAFESGIENVYIIGPYDDGGSDFIDAVCNHVIDCNEDVELVKREEKFVNVIRVDKMEKKVESSFAHLKNPSKTEYLIRSSMVEDVEKFSKAIVEE